MIAKSWIIEHVCSRSAVNTYEAKFGTVCSAAVYQCLVHGRRGLTRRRVKRKTHKRAEYRTALVKTHMPTANTLIAHCDRYYGPDRSKQFADYYAPAQGALSDDAV